MQFNYKNDRFNFLVFTICLLLMSYCFGGCKKLIQIQPPVNSITTTEVFSTDAQSNSALAGIYAQMINAGNPYEAFSNGGITIFGGLSSDELIWSYGPGGQQGVYQFNSNTLQAINPDIEPYFWAPAYTFVYAANAAIAGLAASNGVSDSARSELTGEAKFIRAFCYFYLTNLFGEVPLVLTTDWTQTSLIARTSQKDVYEQIISDLTDAQSLLLTDFSVGGGQRVRPNKYAAAALLARVYLYQKQWAQAESEADTVLNSGQFGLLPQGSLNQVFNVNSTEAIWQLQQNSVVDQYGNATAEATYFIPNFLTANYPQSVVNAYASSFTPQIYLSAQLVNAFDSGDQRMQAWVGVTGPVNGNIYYYPNKYVVSSNTSPISITNGGPIPQYYMVLRSAEQYLIRAEAEANLGDMVDATNDINTIRLRAGLGPSPTLTPSASLAQADSAIIHERQVELFAEWGNRWFDLIRTEQALSTLGAIPLHSAITADQLLYPIPTSELTLDPNLGQNPGY
jgi:hypothetical protein